MRGRFRESKKISRNAKKELEIIGRQFRNVPEARAERSTALVALYSGLEESFAASVKNLPRQSKEGSRGEGNSRFPGHDYPTERIRVCVSTRTTA